jgi:hypothetical protein
VGRAALEAALTTAGVGQLDLVYFLRAGIREWQISATGQVLQIDFRAATRDWTERIELRIHAVPSTLKPAVRKALMPVLRTAAAWVRAAETSENVWRSTDHAFVASWVDSKLLVYEV